jgi:hypothetical protein
MILAPFAAAATRSLERVGARMLRHLQIGPALDRSRMLLALSVSQIVWLAVKGSRRFHVGELELRAYIRCHPARALPGREGGCCRR